MLLCILGFQHVKMRFRSSAARSQVETNNQILYHGYSNNKQLLLILRGKSNMVIRSIKQR